MGMVQENGRIMYAFNGPQGVAQYVALKAVLSHEKIPFDTDMGENELTIDVAPEYGVRVREVVAQWTTAMHVVHHVVWYD